MVQETNMLRQEKCDEREGDKSQKQEERVFGREPSMKREKQIMWSLCGVIGVYWVSGDLNLIVAPETLCLI